MTKVLGANFPDNWSATRIKWATSLLTRGSAPNYADDGAVRVISQASNQDGGIDWSRTRFHEFNGDATKLKGHLLPGDILINSTGTGTLGRVGFFSGAPDGSPCMADSHVTTMRTNKGILYPRYAYYWMRSQPVQDYVYAALVVGATNQIELNRDRLANTLIPLPPLEEQRRIADFLDTETARIDRLTSLRKQQLSTLDERAYAQVSETLLPGILTRPLRRLPWPWLPELPADIPWVKLGYVCRLQNGLTIDSKRDTSGDVVTHPYLRVANVQAGWLDLDSVMEITVPREIAKRSTLRPGDVLMTEGGDLDKLGRGTVWRGEIPNCLHQNHVFALRPESDRLDGEYLALLTQTVHGRCYFESTGTKTTNLASTNSGKIMSFPIPLPPLSRQRALVQEVQHSFDLITRTKASLSRQLDLLTERKQALITAAVTGQFDVSSASGRGVVE